MPRGMGLEEQVLRRVVPSAEEEARISATAADVQRRIAAQVERLGIEAEPLLVGSVAKGTHLTEAELDIFVCFPRTVPRDALEKTGLALGEFLEDKVRMYAEHPYTRGRWKGSEVEIVPCYRIADASERMSAVDRTPLHAAYVIGRLRPGQADQVRLLKAFCEGVGVYGAEAKVQGFSGYLCELLVLRYGTFQGTLEAATHWRLGEAITLDQAATKAFAEPLVVVDPVDPGRNVASAVGEETLATFVHAAREFLVRPDLAYFFPRPRRALTAARARVLLRARGTTLFGLAIPAPKLTDDVLYPQVRKAQRSVEDVWRRAGFRILRGRSAVVGGSVLLLFEFEVFSLSAVEKHRGPPVWVKNAEDFLRRWQGARDALGAPYIEEGHWAVDVRRRSTDAAAFLRANLRELSLGANLDEGARRARFLRDRQLFTKAFLPEVTALLDPRFPWESVR